MGKPVHVFQFQGLTASLVIRIISSGHVASHFKSMRGGWTCLIGLVLVQIVGAGHLP